MKEIISRISFFVISFAVCIGSLLCGICVANLSQDYFQFPGAWCLLNIIPLFVVSFSVCIFLVLGLKKFGEK